MVFGDLNDADSQIAKTMRDSASRQVREDLGLNTGVRYQNL
jgi:molybdopterin-containing oxidoreductase family iron-sulfur binding subunit